MLIQMLATKGLPIEAIGAIAATMLAGAVVALSRSRPLVGALPRVGVVFANPFVLSALLLDGSPTAAILVTVCLLMFAGAFAIAESQNDKGVVDFALASAAGVAIAGVIPVIHGALAFFSPVLTPWRKSPSQIAGFMIVAFSPAVAVILASIYLAWIFDASASGVVAISLFPAAANFNPGNFLAMAAAPSILLGMIFPTIAGGSRQGAVFAALMLGVLCLFSKGGFGAFMILGACAFAAEAAWTMRLKSNASLSLLVVGVISAFLLWFQIGAPYSIDGLAAAIAALDGGKPLIEPQPLSAVNKD